MGKRIEPWKFTLAAMSLAISCGLSTAEQHANDASARAALLGHPEVTYSQTTSPRTAFALGFVPFGAAGFYVNETGLAASGLLWPFSMVWLPELAYQAAIEINDRSFESRMMNALEKPVSPEGGEP